MSKYVNESHITGDKGVAAFHTYCANHTPYILWKPETVNDFGIDGEVELTARTIDDKLEATGEIIKIQIKSTLRGSYIHKETNESFLFRPRKEDAEYWSKHRLDVVLVIYDDRNELLYAKKVSQIDQGYYRQNIPIEISKQNNVLVKGESKFLERFSGAFKQRIRFDIKETLASNLFKFTKLPKFIFQHESNFSSAKEIFNIPDNERPIFVLNDNKIYTFYDVSIYPKFKETAIKKDDSKRSLLTRDVIRDLAKRNFVSELLNKEIKELCYKEKIFFNKQYHRYYFGLKVRTFKERIEYYDGKAGRKDTHRTVVAYREYGSQKFYRHFAFETKYMFTEGWLYLIINPQYLFTSDGKVPLEDKEAITTLTNYLTARERTQQIFNHVHFIFSYLARGKQKLIISALTGSEIELSKYENFPVNFGIPLDNKDFDKFQTLGPPSEQKNLFE